VGKAEAGASTSFQAALATLLVRVCAEHPYHGLYPVFSLKNNDRVATSVMEYDLDDDKVAHPWAHKVLCSTYLLVFYLG
jgi:hypothetical protein